MWITQPSSENVPFLDFVKSMDYIDLKVAPVRLQAVGYGEFVPRDRNTAEIISKDLNEKYNSNPQQKARNRRVEITFLAPNKL